MTTLRGCRRPPFVSSSQAAWAKGSTGGSVGSSPRIRCHAACVCRRTSLRPSLSLISWLPPRTGSRPRKDPLLTIIDRSRNGLIGGYGVDYVAARASTAADPRQCQDFWRTDGRAAIVLRWTVLYANCSSPL